MAFTFLYGTDSWVIYQCHLYVLECFNQHCLHTILKVYWNDFVANLEFLYTIGIQAFQKKEAAALFILYIREYNCKPRREKVFLLPILSLHLLHKTFVSPGLYNWWFLARCVTSRILVHETKL